MFCQLLNNAGRELLIDPGIIVIMSASTMTQQRLVRKSIEYLRILCSQPGGRCSCGSAQNDLHAFFLTKCEEAVEEAEVKPALLRLKDSPAEFGYPDGGYTGILHALQIFPPERFLPLFGIVADAYFIILPLKHGFLLGIRCQYAGREFMLPYLNSNEKREMPKQHSDVVPLARNIIPFTLIMQAGESGAYYN